MDVMSYDWCAVKMNAQKSPPETFCRSHQVSKFYGKTFVRYETWEVYFSFQVLARLDWVNVTLTVSSPTLILEIGSCFFLLCTICI